MSRAVEGRRLAALVLAACTHTVMGAAPVVSDEAPKKGAQADVETRLQRLERVVSGNGLIDLLNQVERLNEEVKRLRGELDQQTYQIEQLKVENREFATRLQQLPQPPAAPVATTVDPAVAPPGAVAPALPTDPEAAAATPPPAADPEAFLPGAAVSPDQPVPEPVVPADAPVATTPVVPVADEDAAYKNAFSLLKAGQYDSAIQGFQQYLAAFPKGRNADNAQYWMAEAHHVSRRFEPAVVEYRKLIANYPQSPKLTHAMLKTGDCLHELGRKDEAIAELTALVRDHPDTTAARLAKERLERWQQEQR